MTPRKGPIGHLLTAAVRFIGWVILGIHHARKVRRIERSIVIETVPLHAGCKCSRP
ncbi:hypothetical protein SALGADO_36 [Arthrobacter phage Salgado]|uniref:Uncharacterized protein n=3 Tax=Laroyevirus TaxID=1982086 RepID=A0A0U4K2E2_9CAUD|nr:hypothetical protein FDH64_gp36 [Arthrobacter phage Laroye]YP_010082548.1 hypothetical protein KMD21_gp35 [Arthrobacter phage LiSara]YP_010082645.1 hypothetical protein KMD22_gp36 [Arthrobacter phage Salgado]ALY09563.1 hypothetical protein LAROYE_36 [Arthrobacter phage Laroye]ALY10204.1 hypothetical protein SALGADO_36 [Arthrobacter phage Salgado]ASR83619.1 hypothetical protein SEA_LISARA_35 [Arthrobacter phage LiSara]